MASTRNRNTNGDYNLEQSQNNRTFENLTYTHYGVSSQTHLPGNGLLQGRIGSDSLSFNAADIESQLRGIGSTNLVENKTPIEPRIKTLVPLNIYERSKIQLPEPLVIENGQRPMFLN
jgi:hypothetical protein|tara:strand:- start:74 stop:427 length:354 start_codon:yes stop_codon:yes gene_type:complete